MGRQCRPLLRSVGPVREKFLPVRLAAAGECRANVLAPCGVLFGGHRATHRLKAQEDEVSVDDVGLAIVPDIVEPAGLECVPDLRAVHAELARQAQATTVALFHHEPERDDEALDRIGVAASVWVKEKGIATQVVVAREGLTMTVLPR